MSEKPEVIVVDAALGVLGRVGLRSKPEDIALTVDGTLLVVADTQSLCARSIRDGGSRWSVSGNFIGCHAVTNYIWAANSLGDVVEVSLHDPATGELLRSTTLEDPFGGSAVMFFAHPTAQRTVIWLAAGQDGQTAYLANDDGRMIRASEIPPRDHLPPTFLADGNTYLTAGDEQLEHRRSPTGDSIAALSWPTIEDEELEDPPGAAIQILPGRFASWSSSNGRIFIVDIDRMKFVDELTIAGHPVRTVEELFPTLRGDRAPCTDFEYSQRGPHGRILTVHARTKLVVSNIGDWSPDPGRREQEP